MDRTRAALGGILAAIVLFGGAMLLRIVARFLFAVVWFLEAVAVWLFAVVVGYVVYRVLVGDSNDPRVAMWEAER